MPDMEQFELDGVVYDVRDPTKAPAGYGLGGFAKRLTSANDLNNVTSFGAYGWNTGSCPSNAPMVSHSYMIVKPWYAEGSLTQEVDVIGYGMIRRVCLVGTWGEWEWVNPPMYVGVEYRTTERWNGKAVYTKAVDCGAMPNASSAVVAHGCAATAIVHRRGTMSGGTTIPYRWGENYVSVSADRTNIHLCDNVDFSSQTATVQLWYTKD